jgi:integration host factor subunit beta
MNKLDLIEKVKEKLGDQDHTEAVVDIIFRSMSDALISGENIEIHGFGSFCMGQEIASDRDEPSIIFDPVSKLDDPEN